MNYLLKTNVNYLVVYLAWRITDEEEGSEVNFYTTDWPIDTDQDMSDGFLF